MSSTRMISELVLDLLRNLVEVTSTFGREDDPLHPGAVRREELRLDPADGEDPSAESALASHRRVGANPPAGEERDERGEDRHTRRGAVLRDCSRGDVDVNVLVLHALGSDAELVRVAPGVRERGPRRLLHHVTQLAGDLDAALAGHPRRLDEEDRAAERRPGEASRDAGDRGSLGDLSVELRLAEVLREVALVDRHRQLASSLRDLERRRAAKLLDLAVELAHSGFARVVAHDVEERLVRDRQLALGDPVLLRSFGDEMLPGNAHLLVRGVAAELDDLEAVAERRRERLEGVRGANEHDLGQVERQLEVVVGERLVLLRIEDFEERGLGRAAPASAHLVDLVEEEDRVLDLRLSERMEDPAGEGPDVGPPVSADLGFVADTAERDPDERSPGRVGDRLAERGLSDARRPDEAKEGPARVARELQHRDVLEDPLLDVLEAVMIRGELGRDLVDVDLGVRPDVPRQVGDELEVVADDVDLGAGPAHALEAPELAVDDLLRVGRKVRPSQTFLQLGEVVAVLAAVELALDRTHVFTKDGLALVLAELLPDLTFDLRADLRLGLPLTDPSDQEPDPARDVALSEELDLLLGRQVEKRPDPVGDERRVHVLVVGELLELLERAARLTDELGDLEEQRTRELLRFERVTADLGQVDDLGLVVGLVRRERVEASSTEAFERELVFALALAGHRSDSCVRSVRVNVSGLEVDRARIFLRQGDDHVARVERAHERDRARAADGEREGGAGKEDTRSKRQSRHGRRGNGDSASKLSHE